MNSFLPFSLLRSPLPFNQPKRLFLLAFWGLLGTCVLAQSTIKGQLQDTDGLAVPFANVALYLKADSSLVKVETTDDAGIFQMQQVAPGDYDLVATYLGMPDLRRPDLQIGENDLIDLGVLSMQPAGIELEAATVTATRALVEIKPDRTVFNVQGTINAVGENGLDLLRKAPGVTIDNNDNINVLSRSGVLVYVDGKRLPLTGDDLANYLRNLTAEQIDRIDIITNPSAKYEAQGNAGIIDIRLKKNENEGANGTVSGTFSQGRYANFNTNVTGNYRNKFMNAFGNLTYAQGEWWNIMDFRSFQNGLFLDQGAVMRGSRTNPNFRVGVDFFLNDQQTLGFLVGGGYQDMEQRDQNDVDIFSVNNGVVSATADSLLRASSFARADRGQNTFNVNYRNDMGQGKSLNVDLDYGRFRNDNLRNQPNTYLSPDGATVLSRVDNYFDTPIEIDIATAKLDYEQPLLGGQFSTGVKLSQVGTDNTFLFYDVDAEGNRELNDGQSNQFNYDERVYAGYVSYAGKLNDQISFSAGLRSEITNATGDLRAFRVDLEEPPVEFNYVSFFPSAGITYALNAQKGNTVSLNYGRRINRPDYNVLNPFRNQISQLMYEKGNPFLSPEIVDNLELGYTLAYRYNFKLAFSRTSNQITRLIGPDNVDPRAAFVGWDNLATQTNYSFNAALPFTVTKSWNAFFNLSGGYLDNQADYGDGVTIDLQAFTYSIFSQHTFQMPGGFTGEISGYFSGPGVWGGVFEYETSGSFNLGLQKKFLDNQMNVKLSGSDLFFTTGWRGTSEFNGLVSSGRGNWDSRRVTLSISYNFGNQKVKSRKRNTGLEDEASRVGG
ncbi:outer membrane beta-barrel protein [Lewinella sp. W8]|uniref:outer membrane beta-barrel protein n=1 Tax=Lewinella sp. W8 TaxID=2528208 RepID=UPI00106720D6|nr:outer membrane beta-barrel protein [Lewinella sp. W8]MTB51826.1 TonB-dependent receptor [Lewinella sp. W8]